MRIKVSKKTLSISFSTKKNSAIYLSIIEWNLIGNNEEIPAKVLHNVKFGEHTYIRARPVIRFSSLAYALLFVLFIR